MSSGHSKTKAFGELFFYSCTDWYLIDSFSVFYFQEDVILLQAPSSFSYST